MSSPSTVVCHFRIGISLWNVRLNQTTFTKTETYHNTQVFKCFWIFVIVFPIGVQKHIKRSTHTSPPQKCNIFERNFEFLSIIIAKKNVFFVCSATSDSQMNEKRTNIFSNSTSDSEMNERNMKSKPIISMLTGRE